MSFLTALLLLFAVFLLFLFLRLRVVFRYETGARFVFIGLEGIGVRYDLDMRQYQGVIYGWVLHRRSAESSREAKQEVDTFQSRQDATTVDKTRNKVQRFSDARLILRALPMMLKTARLFFLKLWRGLRIDECRFHVVVGCPTPDITGIIVGGWYAIGGCVPSISRSCILTPDWEQARFEGEGSVSISMRLYRVLLPLLWLAHQIVRHRMWRYLPAKS